MLEGEGGTTSNRMIKKDLFETMTSELTFSDKKGQHTKIWWQSLPGRGSSKYRAPRRNGDLVLPSHRKVSVGNEPGRNRGPTRWSGGLII